MVQSFKKFREQLNEAAAMPGNIASLLKDYKVTDYKLGGMNFITIDLPDDEDDIPPNLQKLIKDLESGAVSKKYERMHSYIVKSYYSSGNYIEITFINTRISNSKYPKIYHWTKAEYVDKILKNGLIPARGEWNIGSSGKTQYSAVFFVVKANKLRTIQGFKHYKRPKYQLLEIDVPNAYKLYKDVGLYTFGGTDPIALVGFEKIPPENIKLVEKKKRSPRKRRTRR